MSGLSKKSSSSNDAPVFEHEPINVKTPRNPLQERQPDEKEIPHVELPRSHEPFDEPTKTTTAAAAAATPAPPPAAPGALPDPVPPEYLVFHKNTEEDDVGYKAFFEAASNPQTMKWVMAAMRTVAFVSFPLFTISIHPNTMFRLKFPSMIIAAVISTSTHRPHLGEQIGLHTWTLRGMTYSMVLNTVFDSWNLYKYKGAWYGFIAAGTFGATLVSSAGIRRFLYLYFFVCIMQTMMFSYYLGEVPVNNAAWFSADHYLGSAMGTAALIFPYPVLLKTLVDTIMGLLFGGLSKMLMGMLMFVWSPDPHAAAVFFMDMAPFEKIESILAMLPTLLWFSNWEPTEFVLKNNIRRIKLSLLRRIMALTYAAFSAGRTVVTLRRDQADRLAAQRMRLNLAKQAAGDSTAVDPNDLQNAILKDTFLDHVRVSLGEETARKARAEIGSIRLNSAGHVKAFGMALSQCVAAIGQVDNKPETLIKKVPFAALDEKSTLMRRNLRVDALQFFQRQRDILTELAKKQKKDEEELKRKEEEDSASNVPYGAVQRYDVGNENATIIAEYQRVIETNEVLIMLNETFFHVLLSMIAGELQSFKELMENYKPEKSFCRYFIDFFVIEPWHAFWEDLWDQLTFAKPYNIRNVKDGVKMTMAYLTACALNFEIYVVEGGLYFFGTTILLGIPVDEESLSMAVNRLCGNTLGCAIGYLAYHNSKNLSEIMGFAYSFEFILLCFRNHPVYGFTFFYGSLMVLAGAATSMVTLELLTRVIASSYSIFGYTLCCMIIFPNNPVKILWGYHAKLARTISESVDDVAFTSRLLISYDTDLDLSRPAGYTTEAMEMCSHLNVMIDLSDQLLFMCEKWNPIASREPVIRGSQPYPTGPAIKVLFGFQRIQASLKMLVFGTQLMHRPRNEVPHEQMERLFGGPIADFLEDFAGGVRLLSQDFIDALQRSRQWQYPVALRNISYLARMRVRLYMILYEVYVLVGRSMSLGVFHMKENDYVALQDEMKKERDRDDSQPISRPISPHDVFDYNVSFADHCLSVRKDANELGVGDSPRHVEDLHVSFAGSRTGASLSTAGGRGFVHNAALREGKVAPADMYPYQLQSAESTLREELIKKRDQELKVQAEKKAHGEDAESDNISDKSSFQPVTPHTRKSRLVIVEDKDPNSYLPPYMGPNFSYREDQLDLPLDTDFTAMVVILTSCQTIIAEFELMAGYVNSLNGYQKQLHESALLTKTIDKISDKITSLRKANYDKYHPQPPPELMSRGAGTSHVDMWKRWRF